MPLGRRSGGRRPPSRPRVLWTSTATLVLLSAVSEAFLIQPSLPATAPPPAAAAAAPLHRLPVSHATTPAAPAPSPSLEPTPEQLAKLKAEEEVERQQRLGYQRELDRQRHVLVELEGAGPDLLGPLTDILIEGGATEVSYATTTRALGGSSLLLGVTVPSAQGEDEQDWPVDVKGLVRLAVETTSPQGSSSAVRWSVTEAPTPCGIDWMRAAAEPGFDPVLSGKFHVVPVQRSGLPLPPSAQHELRILAGEGWGTGQHPTTRLCLHFLSREGVICGGERIVDYGVGSGILSIAAVQLGAREAVGIDIEVDALVSARVNTQLNNVEDEVDLMHARELVPGEFVPGDIVLANILVGTLLRMANTIIGAVRPGGWLVLCGLRPEQLETIKQKYAPYIHFDDSLEAMEEVELAQASWGTGAGFWVRLVGRKKSVRGESWIEALSESAVS